MNTTTHEVAGVTLTTRELLDIVRAVADGTGRAPVAAWNKAIDIEAALTS